MVGEYGPWMCDQAIAGYQQISRFPDTRMRKLKKTAWEKEKMLVNTSIFSFNNNIFQSHHRLQSDILPKS